MKEFFKTYQISKEDARTIVPQIIDALNYLHERRITHRDFNIENILINPKNLQIKIIDFGLASISNEDEEEEIMISVGNPHYRISNTLSCCTNPFFQDYWGFLLIALIFVLRKNVTTKQLLKMMNDEFTCEINKEMLEEIKNMFFVETNKKALTDLILKKLQNVFFN